MADIISLNPKPGPEKKEQTVFELAMVAYAQYQAEEINAVNWRSIKHHASCGKECIVLSSLIKTGFPSSKDELPHDLCVYWAMQDDLYAIDGVPFKGKKMLIPKAPHPIVSEGLHLAHQKVNSMLANARERFFWPGLDVVIHLYRSQCLQCNEQAPSQPKEPFKDRTLPEVPFEQVATDLCKIFGFSYLIYVIFVIRRVFVCVELSNTT